MSAKLLDGVWVGLLGEVGLVVFDPYIPNAKHIDAAPGGSGDYMVSLWSLHRKSWVRVEIDEARAQLQENLNRVSQYDRELAVKAYWNFRHPGCCTREEYLEEERAAKDDALMAKYFSGD